MPSPPQLAFYELGKRQMPVSLLLRLAKALRVSIEVLVGDAEADAPAIAPRRSKPGPPSKLERQLVD